MKKRKNFPDTKFHVSTIKELIEIVSNKSDQILVPFICNVRINGEDWTFDNIEEFFSEYTKSCDYYYLCLEIKNQNGTNKGAIEFSLNGGSNISIEYDDREIISSCYNVLETAVANNNVQLIKSSEKPKIFIGHGGSSQWKDLKDHLHEKHDYPIVAYEIGARAGHTIRDILDDMLSKSSFACLVLTAEDETKDGQFRARQNVVHETGLFQGRLGFNRAIVLLENGAEEFSNLYGIQQIRYNKDNIKETFGDVLATIKREFG